MRRHCKCQPYIHAAAVAFDGGVEELLDLAEGDDFVELEVDFLAAHAEDAAVHVDVFAAGQFGVEAGADFQQAGHAASDFAAAGGRLDDAAEDFQQRRFARAVAADDANHLARLHLERYVLQRPEVIVVGRSVVVAVGGPAEALP